MYKFEDYIEKANKASSIDDLSNLYSSAIEAEGYENCVLTSVRSKEVGHVAWFDFPDGYAEAYIEKRWERIDPVLACSLRATGPFSWKEAVQQSETSQAQETFLAECMDMGVHSGLVFPMHGPGNRLEILSISRRTQDTPDESKNSLLHALSVQTWSRYLQLMDEDRFPELESINLTRRELEILRWCKHGKTYSEIGDILSISSKTVEFHMGNVMDKLCANNKISAIVIAIQRGLVDL